MWNRTIYLKVYWKYNENNTQTKRFATSGVHCLNMFRVFIYAYVCVSWIQTKQVEKIGSYFNVEKLCLPGSYISFSMLLYTLSLDYASFTRVHILFLNFQSCRLMFIYISTCVVVWDKYFFKCISQYHNFIFKSLSYSCISWKSLTVCISFKAVSLM